MFMTATLPAASDLCGRYVRLTALQPSDLPQLYDAICRPEVFADGYGGGPCGLPGDLDAFRAFFLGYAPESRPALRWAVRLAAGPAAGRVIGTSTLANFDLPNEAAHLGWSAFDPRVWGTAANPETKRLLLDLAFRHGFGRVKIQCDERNARSRAAIEKLGATLEGVLRRERRRADGSWRGTAVYSVLVEDWPELSTRLDARIAGLLACDSVAAPLAG
jgi:RimJ/RimL family protein N-acetyltransferase